MLEWKNVLGLGGGYINELRLGAVVLSVLPHSARLRKLYL
jgi:hypothetical protein